jgi:membrane-bound serine protease (ClpP class)
MNMERSMPPKRADQQPPACYHEAMRTRLRQALVAIVFAALAHGSGAADGPVVVLEVKGGIGVATADYILTGLEYAETRQAELVVLAIDTPGGLVNATRDIIQGILGSKVPVATYVSPAGARAASAGTYILLASHVAAMAPTTSIGAATPVPLGGDFPPPEPDKRPLPDMSPPGDDADAPDADAGEDSKSPESGTAMDRKVLNDAVSYIRSLADRYGRNADWAEEAVRSAATLTDKEALEQNVIEFIAVSQADLLEQLNGLELVVDNETITLDTANAVIERFEPNWRIRFLSMLTDPNVVLILGLIGFYGLLIEAWNPGGIVPGVVGVICLLLAAYGVQALPVNYAGLALILVGLALMTAEAFAPSFGALGLGGIAAFVFGAILMFDSDIPGFGVSLSFVIGIAVASALFIIWTVSYLLKLRRRGAVSGAESIVGGIGVALEDFDGEGRIWLESEAWHAMSKVPIQKDQHVVVTAMDGLVLEVEPAQEGVADAPAAL